MVRVVVYSDQPILAMGLASLIAADPALELNANCSNVAALREHLASGKSDLAVLDLTPEIASALGELQSLAPECKLILWTNSIACDFALWALTIGIRGVLRQTLSLEAHRQCMHRVYSGDVWFEKSLTDSFRARRIPLTRRESQLVSLLSRGLKNREISCELGITEGTVKVYLTHLFQKAGVKDRFGLARQGLKNLGMAGVSRDGQRGLRSLVMDASCPPIES
jgi:DNA-binding NarL/FixJ family response regulator